MIRRQPHDGDSFFCNPKAVLDRGKVVQQIAVRQHDAFRIACRAGCVLQKGKIIAGNVRMIPFFFIAIQIDICSFKAYLLQPLDFREHGLYLFEQRS